MKLYLQKGNGPKYWVHLKANGVVGVSSYAKDATDIPMQNISRVKHTILTHAVNHPQLEGLTIKSHVVKVTDKSKNIGKNTIGKLASLTYKSSEDGQLYHHTFKSQPALAYSSEKKLVIIGGKYKITDRGIIG